MPNFYYSPADDVIHPIFTDEVANVTLLGKDANRAWEDAQDRVRREVEHKMPFVRFESTGVF